MATINSGALRSKLNAFLNSTEGRKRVAGSADVSGDIAAVESAFVQTMLGCASGASGVASDFHSCGGSISNGGGEIIACGTPKEISKCEKSFTGQFLKPILERGY